MQRVPSVAGQFYPADQNSLTKTISAFVPDNQQNEKQNALAVVSPHAGYIYSGALAAETFAKINIPETVIILGPNHHGLGEKIAVMSSGSWLTPLGEVNISKDLAAQICQSPLFKDDLTAHIHEHSLEVQVPFLQFFCPALKIVPICVSHISLADCLAAGQIIADAIKKSSKPVLIVASTDMSHYESRDNASRKDNLAMNHINSLDPEGLYRTVLANGITMCGVMPTTITLAALNQLGATEAKLVKYTDSGAVNGDLDRVVGYAGYIIS